MLTKGFSFIGNSLPKGVATFRKLLRRYRKGARDRGLLWNLTEDQFGEITKRDCYYCGDSPYKKEVGPQGNYTYNGIDRIDNEIGYFLENVVSCCEICNRMKLTMGYDNFLIHISKIYQYHVEEK